MNFIDGETVDASDDQLRALLLEAQLPPEVVFAMSSKLPSPNVIVAVVEFGRECAQRERRLCEMVVSAKTQAEKMKNACESLVSRSKCEELERKLEEANRLTSSFRLDIAERAENLEKQTAYIGELELRFKSSKHMLKTIITERATVKVSLALVTQEKDDALANVAKLEAELASFEEAKRQLTASREELLEKVEKLKQQVANLETDRQKETAANKALRGEKAAVEAKLSEERRQLKAKQAEVDGLRSELGRVEKVMTAKVAELESALAQERKSNLNFKAEIDRRRKESQVSSDQVSSLQRRLQYFQRQTNQPRTSANAQASNCNELEEAKQTIATLENELSKLKTEIESLSADKMRLETEANQLATVRVDFDKVKGEANELRTKLERSHQNLIARDLDLKQYQRSNSDLKNRLETEKNSKEELAKQKTEAEGELARVRDECEKLKQELAEAIKKVDQHLTVQLENERQNCQRLLREKEQNSSRLEQEQLSISRIDELEDLRKQVNEFELALQTTCESFKVLSGEKAGVDAELSQTKQDLAACRKRQMAQDEQIASLLQQLDYQQQQSLHNIPPLLDPNRKRKLLDDSSAGSEQDCMMGTEKGSDLNVKKEIFELRKKMEILDSRIAHYLRNNMYPVENYRLQRSFLRSLLVLIEDDDNNSDLDERTAEPASTSTSVSTLTVASTSNSNPYCGQRNVIKKKRFEHWDVHPTAQQQR